MKVEAGPEIEIRTTVGPAGVVVGIRGEVDISTAPDVGAVMDALVGRGHRDVVVDLSGVSFMDASGLRLLARAASALTDRRGRLTVAFPSPMIRRMLVITGLTEAVTILPPERPTSR